MTNVEDIPKLLAERNQWVLWRAEERDGSTTKVPYRPNGKRASTSEPTHWSSLEDVRHALGSGNFDGIGFVFTDGDPFVGVDLDHCAESGELEEWARRIVDDMGSYTEWSPSGEGVHIIAEGNKPGDRCRSENIEMYDHARYFTVTGEHLSGTPETVKEREDAIARIYRSNLANDDFSADPEGRGAPESIPKDDEKLLERIRSSQQAEKFELLWQGITNTYDSHSEADLALASILAHWGGGDRERVDRLFRKSGLYRDKWERDDYRRRTLEKALDGRREYSSRDGSDGSDGNSDTSKKNGGPKQADRLLELANDADVFQSPMGNVYATFEVNGHRETHELGKNTVRRYLTRRFHQSEGTIPRKQVVSDVVRMLESKAKLDRETKPVHTRVGRGDDGAIYIDLGGPEWKAVKVTAEGWKVVESPPVHFRRTRSVEPLPPPDPDGDIRELLKFVNALAPGACLVISWLLGALRPEGPYPVLVLQGEQGSAKSTLARFLRRLVDPSSAPLRGLSKGSRDLMISAKNSHVIAFDNVSTLRANISDDLCRLATGGGFATRELHSDSQEVIFNAARPIILTGIDEVASRDDLAERALILNLESIPKSKRKTERELEAEFEKAAPKILGGILDALVAAQKNVDQTIINGTPRMADFAEWVSAAEPGGLPWIPGYFLRCHEQSREKAVIAKIESDPVARGVRDLLKRQAESEWEGTPTELKEALDRVLPDVVKNSSEYPSGANWVGRKLERAKGMLREIGIECRRYHHKQERKIQLEQK